MKDRLNNLTPLSKLPPRESARLGRHHTPRGAGKRCAITTHVLRDLRSLFAGSEHTGGRRRVRICVVDTMLQTGGAEWFAAQLALRANASIFEFVFVTFNSQDSFLAKRLTSHGIRVICATTLDGKDLTFSDWKQDSLFAFLARLSPDILFFSSQYLFEKLPRERLSPYPVVVRISNFHAQQLGKADFSLAEKVVCCTDEQFACVSATHPHKPLQIKTGVDTTLFRSVSSEEKERLKRSHGLGGKTVVLFVARLGDPLKRTGVFQDVVRAIKAAGTDIAFLVVGYFESHNNQGESTFRSFVAQEEIVWLERVPPWEMPQFYQTADILLSTSAEHEGLSNTVLQALACGVVPVVTASAGMHELVIPDETGFLVERNDARSIAHAVTRAANLDSATRATLIENGRRNVKMAFNLTQCALDYQRVFLEVYRRQPARICITDGCFGVGGAEWLAALLIANSDPREVRFELAVHRADGPLIHWLQQRGVTVHEALPQLSYGDWERQGMEDVFRRTRPDIVMPCTITTWPKHDPFYRLLIISQNASDAEVLTERQYQQADYFLCVSEDVKNCLSADYHWKMTVLRNSVDVEMFSPNPEWRSQVRAQLGISAGAKVILWCGRMHERRKRLDVLMDVIAETGSDAAVHFLVLGYFRGDEGDKEVWLNFLAAHKNVSWVAGVTPLETPRYYSAADIYLSTSGFKQSDFEGLSLATVQALAAQLPVVSTMSGGQREVIEDGVNGRLVEPGDVGGLAAALREILLGEPDQLLEIREQNRRKALECFDIREHVRTYSRISRLIRNTVGAALASDASLPTPSYSFNDDPCVSHNQVRKAASFLRYTWPLIQGNDSGSAPLSTEATESRRSPLLGASLDAPYSGPGFARTDNLRSIDTHSSAGTTAGATPANGAVPLSTIPITSESGYDATLSQLQQTGTLLEPGGWLVIDDLGPDYLAPEPMPQNYGAGAICAVLDYLEISFPMWSHCERRGAHLRLQKQ